MESKKQGFDIEAVKACFGKIKEDITVKDICNSCLMFIMFAFYTLTFFVPKFYGFTEKYVGLFFFAALAALFAVNVNPITKIRAKDRDLIILLLITVLTGVNILITGSGFGCFFVMVNFALI